MKNILIFIVLLISSITSYGQFCTYIIDSTSTTSSVKNEIIVDQNTSVKQILVNIYYLLRSDSTGNFNESSDGLTPSNAYNGYQYAWDLIYGYDGKRVPILKCSQDGTNAILGNNQVMWLQTSNIVPAIETKYEYVLNAVYYIRNTADYDLAFNSPPMDPTYLWSKYSNQKNAINLFLTCSHKGYYGGGQSVIGGFAAIFYNIYTDYASSVKNGNWWYNVANAKIINHEIGHSLSLEHTIFTPKGKCCDGVTASYCDDGCDDTPTWQYLHSNGNPNPCAWNESYSSNNIMDYDAEQNALSPCQINKVHTHIVNNKMNLLLCKSVGTDLNVISFSDSQILFSGQNVSIPANSISGTSMIVKSNQIKNIVFSNSLTLNPGFEVQLGGELNVSIQPYCQ